MIARAQDKVVLVTGGAAGIGKATALRFAEEGAKVVICDVNEAVGQETLKELGEGAAFYKVNVTSREDVQKWVDDVVAKYGRIDVIVSNAGVLRDGQLVKVKEGNLVGQMSEPDFDLVISVNLKGVFNCAQAVAPVMAKQGGGVILNASSVVGLDGNFGQTNYVATKFGVIGMTKSMARELASRNVTVNAVAPGFIDTDMTKGLGEQVREDLLKQIPAGRLGRPEEISEAVLFLASPGAAYITGQTLAVNGGMLMP